MMVAVRGGPRAERVGGAQPPEAGGRGLGSHLSGGEQGVSFVCRSLTRRSTKVEQGSVHHMDAPNFLNLLNFFSQYKVNGGSTQGSY